MSHPSRQLAAIMFTDIVGYTQMMGEDEDKAAKMRERHRAVLTSITEKHDGRILQYYGDGTLSIFSSSLEAVECAIEIQQQLQDDPVIPLRIGIHTGDIVHSEEEVYGDGVNVASRIESACIPGGVFISGKVYDDIKNHTGIEVKSLGNFALKNVSQAVKFYALVNHKLTVPDKEFIAGLSKSGNKVVPIASRPYIARPLILIPVLLVIALLALLSVWYIGSQTSGIPDDGQVSIAVLPFTNMTTGEEHEYFSDGITEDILSLLSGIEGFKVISRTSVMQYKNTSKNIREIGKELMYCNKVLQELRG